MTNLDNLLIDRPHVAAWMLSAAGAEPVTEARWSGHLALKARTIAGSGSVIWKGRIAGGAAVTLPHPRIDTVWPEAFAASSDFAAVAWLEKI